MLYAIPVKAAEMPIHYGAKQYKIENKRVKKAMISRKRAPK